MHLTYWKIVPFRQKRFSECDIELISKNLSESTCPVVIIETLPDPQDIRIDIRIVSFAYHRLYAPSVCKTTFRIVRLKLKLIKVTIF